MTRHDYLIRFAITDWIIGSCLVLESLIAVVGAMQ